MCGALHIITDSAKKLRRFRDIQHLVIANEALKWLSRAKADNRRRVSGYPYNYGFALVTIAFLTRDAI